MDFTIEIYNLNTSPTPEIAKNQLLFSDDLLFEISHVNNKILPGYFVNLGRALFSVKKKKIIIDNLMILPKWQKEKGKSKINLKAGKIFINGLDLSNAETIADVKVSSIQASDGYVAYFLPEGIKASQDTLSKNKLVELKKKIKPFRLDSVLLHNFNFYNIRNEDDTVMAVHDIDFFNSSTFV